MLEVSADARLIHAIRPERETELLERLEGFGITTLMYMGSRARADDKEYAYKPILKGSRRHWAVYRGVVAVDTERARASGDIAGLRFLALNDGIHKHLWGFDNADVFAVWAELVIRKLDAGEGLSYVGYPLYKVAKTREETFMRLLDRARGPISQMTDAERNQLGVLLSEGWGKPEDGELSHPHVHEELTKGARRPRET